jgi:hypothetical protein
MAKRNLRGLASTLPNGSAVADFKNYQEAVAYVERIILGEFPVTSIAIVGTNLKSVERVRTRISYGKVAVSGAATGSWLGLLIYIVFGFGTTPPAETPEPLFSLGSAILVGAGLGMLFQIVRFSLSKTKAKNTSPNTAIFCQTNNFIKKSFNFSLFFILLLISLS